jgi:hypothetical protein
MKLAENGTGSVSEVSTDIYQNKYTNARKRRVSRLSKYLPAYNRRFSSVFRACYQNVGRFGSDVAAAVVTGAIASDDRNVCDV